MILWFAKKRSDRVRSQGKISFLAIAVCLIMIGVAVHQIKIKVAQINHLMQVQQNAKNIKNRSTLSEEWV